MTTQYHCSIANKFAYLDDDGTDPALVAKKMAKEEALKPVQPTKPSLPPKEKDDKRPNNQRTRRGPRDGGNDLAERFGEKRQANRENRGPRRDGPPRDGNQRPRVPRPEQLDEEGKPIRRQQRPRGGEHRPVRRDRASGSEKTGVRSVAKKDGHGKGNWGDNNDVLVGETENLNITENKENDTENAEKPTEAVEDQPEEEKEPPKLTLSEWKAQQKLEKQQFKTRAANEGSDQKNLSKFVALKKEEQGDDEEEEVEVEVQKTKRQQANTTVDVRINFANPNRNDRPERGPRTFGNDRRGTRPQGSQPQKGGRRFENSHVPKIDSAHEFPALGS